MTTTRDGARPVPAPDPVTDPTGDALAAELAQAIREVRLGNFDVRMVTRDGAAGEVVDEFNALVALQDRRNRDLLRISRVVGREGHRRRGREHRGGAECGKGLDVSGGTHGFRFMSFRFGVAARTHPPEGGQRTAGRRSFGPSGGCAESRRSSGHSARERVDPCRVTRILARYANTRSCIGGAGEGRHTT